MRLRNQHAEHDTHLADERAPAVQRFGKMEIHPAGPHDGWKPTRRANVHV